MNEYYSVNNLEHNFQETVPTSFLNAYMY